MDTLQLVSTSENCAIYQIPHDDSFGTLRRLVVSTPETRQICNDPFVTGVEYTRKLEAACARTIRQLGAQSDLGLAEAATTVLHILRAGLNFGLREALHSAYGWNDHASAFISAQRMRQRDDSENWYISENSYQKVFLPKESSIVFGDIVATGTSLQYALRELLTIVEDGNGSISSILFFTIGGSRAESILREIDMACRNRFPRYKHATLVYLEGRFSLAKATTPVRTKVADTDLLRTHALLAPEFISSQYENPAYPLERCAIYGAGSRAFWLPEHLRDVHSYWSETLSLAERGLTFDELLRERFAELDLSRFASVDLRKIAQHQVERCGLERR